MTSPPPARTCEMNEASTPPVRGRLPSHLGVQPPPDNTNAMVNHFTPVALMTVLAAGGLPHPSKMYGAAAMPALPPVHPVVVADTLAGPDSPALLYARSV